MGSDTSFAAAVCAERGYLLRYANRQLRDAALAEDIVQDTLVAAWRAEDRFEQRAALRTWLTGILQRRIADSLRRAYRSPVLAPLPDRGDDTDDDDDTTPEGVDWIDPERTLAARQGVAALAAGLAAMPAAAARVVALRGIDGLDNGAAASVLGITPRSCVQLLHRARRQLRERLAAPQLQGAPA